MTVDTAAAGEITLHCDPVIRPPFFTKCSQNTPHSSPARASYGVPFVSSNYDLRSTIAIAALYITKDEYDLACSYEIQPYWVYIGTPGVGLNSCNAIIATFGRNS